MAYTKIFAIRARLDDRVKYAINGEKTELNEKIGYAADFVKTGPVRFVTALNCKSAETAFDVMQKTKKKFGKTGGVLGYHFIQSFAPGEVTPEQAHEIGCEFTRRLFGEDFEAVIGTHLDKAHPHNHIIVNSVSRTDGHKYHSSPESYTMAANAAAVKQLTDITEDKTVTFEYEPIDKQMVYIHVRGVGPDSKTLFESRESVTHGTASKEVNVFTPTGLKLASATVGGADKTNAVANGKLIVDLTSVTKGGTVEVLLTYESNMTDVTVNAMYNGQPIQS
ncbi:relaxase/mobilization nuclease domain-containing protein [Flavonifractor plautii]|uniref:relaxase/mobilization nuclease domain-containing protein n=1 Tax=Flavonifractor plautii TaxID=292800 RepID=UPI001EDFE257|nr:relaxase/mobilization nuclease domain-containing protein [Flavonifractor plautii]MCG4656940.1 relaxase/mobilization nuclease domain-containing protein [Flavonifractor plautii]